jgi:hypothetical protein
MKPRVANRACTFVFVILAETCVPVSAQASWRIETGSETGSLAQVDLPGSGSKRRTSLLVFEYARRCDPLFSFVEINGLHFGSAVGQSVLKDSQIGIVINGEFHTWHAAITNYDNGYEAAVGITNELFAQLLLNIKSLEYVTPMGERVPLPTDGFREAVTAAANACSMRVR